jgi:hypothetical protein
VRARPRALVPAVALLAFVAGCGDDAPPSTSGTTTSTTTTDEPSPTSSDPTVEPPAEPTDDAQVGAYATVDAWLAATASGDAQQVLAGLGPSSLRAVEAMGGIEPLMSGLAEGMSTYAQPGLARTAVEVRPGAWLVTYAGQRQVEGTTEASARSWLVVDEGEGPKVEAFVHPLPEVVAPADPAAATATDVVTVTLPAGGDALAYLDGTTPVPVQVEPADGDLVRVTAAPEGGLPSGTHGVTVVVVPGDEGGTTWASTTVVLTVT